MQETVSVEHPQTDQAHSSPTADLVTGITTIMLVAALTTIMSKRFKQLPLTIALVFVGIIISALAPMFAPFAFISQFQLTPDLVLFVFLPTLIFESAFNLDARQLGRNILPVLTLAVPGLLFSTFIIGGIMFMLTDFDFIVCLLLGSILSATDPVAVISLFKQLGVPERLTVLVEGESLFNDATSLVLATLLLGILTAGSFTGAVVTNGILEFLVVFFGGVIVGSILAYAVCVVLGKIEADAFIEISFTTILAYFSFILAEHFLHVSGIMAVVAAGIIVGSYGRSKISPATAEFMEHFWEYLASLANAFIFLMVGLQVILGDLWQSADLIAYVITAMLISRAIVVFSLTPLVGKLPGAEPVGMAFQKVMYWGGLRGAIALAIVLALPEFEYKQTLTAIVMGAVLFTLIVQGLSIETLVVKLGLNKLDLSDNLAKKEGDKAAREQGLSRLQKLVEGGLFSARVADIIAQRCEENIASLNEEIDKLQQDLTPEEGVKILAMRTLTQEKVQFYELFGQGLISEWAFRELDYNATVQLEAAKHFDQLPVAKVDNSLGKRLGLISNQLLQLIPGFGNIVEANNTRRIMRDYDVAWGRHRASTSILNNMDTLAKDNGINKAASDQVTACYNNIQSSTKQLIDEVAETYPEFVEAMQEKLAERLLLMTEHETIEHAAEMGFLPEGVAHKILHDQESRLRQLKSDDLSSALEISVEELLAKVPFLADINQHDFGKIADSLRAKTIPKNHQIIRQGDKGDSLFLIARGISKVFVKDEQGENNQVATFYAGDLFGEAALLHATPRNATVTAATPCSLYELNRTNLDLICEQHPTIKAAVEAFDKARH